MVDHVVGHRNLMVCVGDHRKVDLRTLTEQDPQLSPSQSQKLIAPCVVSTVKPGALSRDALSCSAFQQEIDLKVLDLGERSHWSVGGTVAAGAR